MEKTSAFTDLTRLLASQIGNLIAISELASTLALSAPTVKQYLWYLEKTYIIHRVPPYFKNARKEITKMPTFYFYDLGLRNFAEQKGMAITMPDGLLFENFVFLLLHESFSSLSYPIRFWRTKSGAEVDFIIDRGTSPIAVEVKSGPFRAPIVGKSLRSFIQRYKPPHVFIVTKDYMHTLMVDTTAAHFVPFYMLPHESML